MTDKPGGILDAAQQAIRMERLEGQQALLAQRVASGVENVASTLASVQSELRHVAARMGEVASLQKSHDSNKEAIDKMERSVGVLNARLEEWFDDFDNRNNEWRREHEAHNEDTKRDLEKEIRSVRETVIRGIGWGSGVAVLAGLVAAGFIWNLNYRFNDVTGDSLKDTTRIEATAQRNRQLIDEQTEELDDIKLYLARGGKIPEEPYIPQSQRKGNGQRQSAN